MKNRDIRMELKALKKQLNLLRMEIETLISLRKYVTAKNKILLPKALLTDPKWA